MAIRLVECKTLILELPKTGTTWIRSALNKLNILHDIEKPPGEGCCERHSPWWCYESSPHYCCCVRHPISWYESYWTFHQFHGQYRQDRYSCRKMAPLKEGQWHIRRPLHFEDNKMDYTFGQWIDRVVLTQPAIYTRIVEAFVGPVGYPMMDTVLKQENLVEDLALFLESKGYGNDLYSRLLKVPRVNVSRRLDVEWESGQREAVMRLEQEVVKRFYS